MEVTSGRVNKGAAIGGLELSSETATYRIIAAAGVAMSRRCTGCGAQLSSYNEGLLCWPCQEKKWDHLQERIMIIRQSPRRTGKRVESHPEDRLVS